MRLICPNCGAQYEVDEQVIPDSGRDVQCSNCGHTWFQRPAHLDQDLADELDEDLPDSHAPEPDLTEEAPAHDEEPAEPEPHATEDAAREPRGLDPDVTEVLREEAAREAEARRAEQAGLETQPDLGLEEASEQSADRTAAARARMARLRGIDETSPEAISAAAAAAASGSRRDLLPDIEEINSTLRASQDREDGEDTAPDVMVERPAPKSGRRGFRAGFGLMMVLLAAAVLFYAFAPQIIARVPGAEPYLIGYVDWANTARTRADAVISTSLDKVNGLIASVTGD